MALIAPAVLFAGARLAAAQDATWVGGTNGNDYATSTNWTPATTPSGTATFATNANNNIPVSILTTLGAWNFTGTSAYNFTINSGGGVTFSGAGINITGGSVNITNNGEFQFQNSSTAASASIVNNGTTAFFNLSTAGTANITNNNKVQFSQSSTAGSATITTYNGATVNFLDTSTGGNARFVTNAGGSFDMSALTSTGMTAGSIAGAGNYFLGSKTLTVGSNNLSTTVSGVISDGSAGGGGGTGGALTKVGSGTLTLTGLNAYTGATTINGGGLEVDGSIASSSGVTVNSGGTLSGTGIAGPTTITSGGTLAPGSAANPTGTLAISGNLAFQSGALYVVQVTPLAASATTISGSATLTGGTVNAQFASGTYIARQYIVLSAANGLGGTTFKGLTNTNLPAGFTDSLSYSGNKVTLNLTAVLGSSDPSSPIGAQHNVATSLNNAFNFGSGVLPANFVNVFGLTGSALTNALTQLDGEAATGAERSAFQLTNQFMTLMLDPYVDGRGGPGSGGYGGGGNGGGGYGGAGNGSGGYAGAGYGAAPGPGCAPGPQGSVPSNTSVFGLSKDCALRGVYEPRWSAWGSAFGGSSNANGNTSTGSTNVTAGTFGFAGGMDYHVTPNTLFGFALAGAGTNWGLSNSLGSGRSDALQVGAYGINWFGPAYVAGALSFTNNWFTTSRSALGDQLNANFSGQTYSARAEGGYRFAVLPTFGVTPYGAVQFQDFFTPSYSESDVTGGGFGLSYASNNATDVRTELGSRFDAPTIVYGKPVIFYGRLAWAHDFVNAPALNASFQALPGSSFTVTGAAIANDSALTTAGAQIFFTPNWSLLAKFDGEFAGNAQTYAGSGTLRYTW
jgi:autotransporter-associated beta strand protein